MPYQFEWDADKAAANLRKHGVSFDEAVTALAIRWRSSSRTQIIQSGRSGTWCWACPPNDDAS